MTETRPDTKNRNRISRLGNAVVGFLDSVHEAKRMRDEFYRKNPQYFR